MAVIASAVMASFVVVSALELPVLTDPAAMLSGGGVAAAAAGVALLVVDVVLPVPSSLVMVAHGAAFGVAAGTALSLLGTVGAAVLGALLGRRGAGLVHVSEEDRLRAHRLIERWGAAAVVATRPVPVLAETVAVAAGGAGASAVTVGAAAAVGGLPAALLYALAGSLVVDAASGALIFMSVLALAGLVFALAAWRRRPSTQVAS